MSASTEAQDRDKSQDDADEEEQEHTQEYEQEHEQTNSQGQTNLHGQGYMKQEQGQENAQRHGFGQPPQPYAYQRPQIIQQPLPKPKPVPFIDILHLTSVKLQPRIKLPIDAYEAFMSNYLHVLKRDLTVRRANPLSPKLKVYHLVFELVTDIILVHQPPPVTLSNIPTDSKPIVPIPTLTPIPPPPSDPKTDDDIVNINITVEENLETDRTIYLYHEHNVTPVVPLPYIEAEAIRRKKIKHAVIIEFRNLLQEEDAHVRSPVYNNLVGKLVAAVQSNNSIEENVWGVLTDGNNWCFMRAKKVMKGKKKYMIQVERGPIVSLYAINKNMVVQSESTRYLLGLLFSSIYPMHVTSVDLAMMNKFFESNSRDNKLFVDNFFPEFNKTANFNELYDRKTKAEESTDEAILSLEEQLLSLSDDDNSEGPSKKMKTTV